MTPSSPSPPGADRRRSRSSAPESATYLGRESDHERRASIQTMRNPSCCRKAGRSSKWAATPRAVTADLDALKLDAETSRT
jgi:hypothetical protein